MMHHSGWNQGRNSKLTHYRLIETALKGLKFLNIHKIYHSTLSPAGPITVLHLLKNILNLDLLIFIKNIWHTQHLLTKPYLNMKL